MLWLLGYLIIGMVYSSILTRKALVQSFKESEYNDQEKAIATIVTLILTCIYAVIWPVLITFGVIDKVSKLKK
ncbi:hypothetical protein [Bacillus wiedmannii]|uniref:Uncharacterized protein n=1 Tax=Bacillus wiedmannii TaxID=1890302 RepID=A0A2A8BSP6_9BACI|nr:hypothetical protein [Bacillus wiedmannii]PEM57637.1 hypothetical protein CN611_07450 [Bacillus wiedmannii]